MKLTDLDPWPKGHPPSHRHCGEETRAFVLAQYGLDALEDDPELAHITAFAAQLCGAPIAAISLVEEKRQRFLTRTGLEMRETPRSASLCAHTMLEPEPVVVPDAMKDARFAGNPLVTGPPHIRFYAGAPLISHEGAPLGALCVISSEERPGGLDAFQTDGLQVLAEAVMRRLRHRREKIAAEADIIEKERELHVLSDSIPDMAWTADKTGRLDYFNGRWREYTGRDNDHGDVLIHPEDRDHVIGLWRAVQETGETYETQCRFRRHDGEYRWVLVRAVALKDEDGRVARWFGTNTDIHDFRRLSDSRDLLSRELSHRIKNIFAVVSGLVSLRARKYPEAKSFAADLTDTVRSLGRAHDFVRPLEGDKGDNLAGLLHELMAPYLVDGEDRITIEGADIVMSPRVATPLALVFHELATNAAKYGALSNDTGTLHIKVETSESGEDVRVLWRERKAPLGAKPDKSGFGSRLVQQSVERQLGGSIRRDWHDGGVDVVLTVPKDALVRR